MQPEGLQDQADLGVVERDALGKVDDLRINIDVIDDVCDDALLLAEFGSIIEEGPAFRECYFEVPNDLCKRCDVKARRPECAQALAFEAVIGLFDDGLDSGEIRCQTIESITKLYISLRCNHVRSALTGHCGVKIAKKWTDLSSSPL